LPCGRAQGKLGPEAIAAVGPVIEQFTMRRQAGTGRQIDMRMILRIVLYLAVVAVVGLVGLAVFSDLPAPQREVEVPVEAK
jgi:hypothetical protein